MTNRILQATESLFENPQGSDGSCAVALLPPVTRKDKLIQVSARETQFMANLLDDISRQLSVSRAEFISMAIHDAVEQYQLALYETGIRDHSTMRGFNAQEIL